MVLYYIIFDKRKLLEQLQSKFMETCKIINLQLPSKPFHIRGRVNYAAMDSIFNALASINNYPDDLETRYQTLISDTEFIENATLNTSDSRTLEKRFKRAIEILSK